MHYRLIRILVGLAILLGWMVGGSYGLSRASPLAQDDGQAYIVRAGDSLVQISGRFYGDATRWPEIFEATNAKAGEDNSFATINNPRIIYVGQKLWIPSALRVPPSEPMMGPTVATQQPVAPVQPSAEPTPQPTVSNSGTTSKPAEAITTSIPSNETSVSPERILAEHDPTDALASAQSQMQLALTHLGFLRVALGEGDQTQVLRHAEHLVNILEGEEGVLFGDNDRDGQAQNPGDGVGVRAHVADAQAQVESVLVALEQTTVDAAVRTQVQELAASLERSQELVQQTTDKAFQTFSVDTDAETKAIETELDALLNELQTSIANAFTIGSQLLPSSQQASETQSGGTCEVVVARLNVRSGPGVNYQPPSGLVEAGDRLLPLGRNEAATWILMRVVDSNVSGWVSALPDYIACERPLQSLPVEMAPPVS